jgi:hypothetical protein
MPKRSPGNSGGRFCFGGIISLSTCLHRLLNDVRGFTYFCCAASASPERFHLLNKSIHLFGGFFCNGHRFLRGILKVE